TCFRQACLSFFGGARRVGLLGGLLLRGRFGGRPAGRFGGRLAGALWSVGTRGARLCVRRRSSQGGGEPQQHGSRNRQPQAKQSLKGTQTHLLRLSSGGGSPSVESPSGMCLIGFRHCNIFTADRKTISRTHSRLGQSPRR